MLLEAQRENFIPEACGSMNESAKPQWQVGDGHEVHLQCQEAQLQLAGSKKDQEKNTIPKKWNTHYLEDDSVLPSS